MPITIGATDKKYVTALGIDTREWLPELLSVNNDEGLIEMLEMVGRYRKITQPIYSHWVMNAMHQLLDTTGATVTGSGTTTVGTTLTAGSSGQARPTDLVIFPNGKVGYVTVVTGSPNVLTIISVDGTNLTHTAGQKLGIFSGAVGERSKEPRNRRYDMAMHTNKIQAFREVNEMTDVQMASTVEITYNGSQYLIDRERAIKEMAFKVMINGGMFAGKMSVTSYSDASPVLIDPTNGGAVQTTRGLDSYITTYGIDDAVAVDGAWNFTDLEDTIGRLIAARTGSNYIVAGSTMAMLPVMKFLKGISTGITAGRLNLDGKSFEYSVDALTYAGFSLQFKTWRALDHPEIFSQTDISKSLYGIPTDGVKTFSGDRSTQPRIQIVWQDHGVQNDFGNEIYAEFDTGALARKGPTDSEMVNKLHIESHQGLQVLGAQHFFKLRTLAA